MHTGYHNNFRITYFYRDIVLSAHRKLGLTIVGPWSQLGIISAATHVLRQITVVVC